MQNRKMRMAMLCVCWAFVWGILGAPAQAAPKELTIAMVGDVVTWYPFKRNEVIANSVQRHVFEGLMAVGSDLSSIPALAVKWEANADSTVWTFKLREGVKYHNGNAFNADDVVFSFDTCNVKTNAWSSAFSSVSSYKKIDDYTIEVTCKAPDALLPAVIRNVMILDKETYDGKDEQFYERTIVGTGPYVLSEYIRDDKTIFLVNEGYWGTKPEATKVTLRAIPNPGTRIASILTQEVDMIGNVPVRDAKMLQSKDFLTVTSAPSMGVMFYNLAQCAEDPSKNSQLPLKAPDGSNPLRKKEVRLAIVSSINYDELIKQVMNGYATPAPTLIPEGFNGYNPDISQYKYDPAMAEKLLDEAGYPRQSDGYRFEMTLDATNDRYINDAAAATALAGYMDKVGIKCNVNLMSRSVYFSYIKIHDEGGDNSHFMQSGWSDPSGESVLYAQDLLYSVTLQKKTKEGFGAVNRGYYNNPELDKLIDQALETPDWGKRHDLMQKVWQIVHDDVALFTTYFTNDIYAVNKRVSYTPRMDQMIYAMDFKFK